VTRKAIVKSSEQATFNDILWCSWMGISVDLLGIDCISQ